MTTENTLPPEPPADADWLPPGGWRQANDWARANRAALEQYAAEIEPKNGS